MGLSDGLKYKGIDFQTKSLDSMNEEYEIWGERIFKTRKTLQGWKTEYCKHKVKFTGTVTFYRLLKSNRLECYDAFFRQGKMISIHKYFEN